MENNEIINDLNNILSSLPNADTPSLVAAKESIISNLHDLTANLASVENTVDVDQRVESKVNEYEELLEHYNKLLEELRKRRELGSYESPRSVGLEKRKEELTTSITSKNEDIARVTEELEDYTAFNTKIKSMLEGYDSISRQALGMKESGTMLSADDNKLLDRMVVDNETHRDYLDRVSSETDQNINQRREELVILNNDVAVATQEITNIDNEIVTANEEYRETAIAKDNADEVLYETSANGLSFANNYNILNPREKLQQMITDYSTGSLDNEGLTVALTSLKADLSSLGINSNTPENIALSKAIYEKNIAEVETNSSIVSVEERQEDLLGLNNDKLVLKSLSMQEKCINCDVINKIDVILGKIQQMSMKVEPVVEPTVVKEPIVEAEPVVGAEPVAQEEPIKTNMPMIINNLSPEDKTVFDKHLQENFKPEEQEEAMVEINDALNANPEEQEVISTEEAPEELQAKSQTWWQRNKQKVIHWALAVIAGALLLTNFGSCNLEQKKDDETFNPPLVDSIDPGQKDPNIDPVVSPEEKEEELNENEKFLEDYQKPDEVGENCIIIRNGKDGTGAAESLSYVYGDKEYHITIDGTIVDSLGNAVGKVPINKDSNGDTYVDSETAYAALEEAQKNALEAVQKLADEAGKISKTGNEMSIDDLGEDFVPTSADGTNIAEPDNEKDNVDEAAANIFEEFGFEDDQISMGGK